MQRTFMFEAIRFPALGTNVLAVSPAADDLARAIRETVEEHEERFSRFRASSELERISARAGRETPVSPAMFQVLSLASTFWCETQGIFDPLVRRELEGAGYDRTFERVPGAAAAPAAAPARRRLTYAAVQLDPETQSVHLPEGCALDLGGIAKGWIVDRLGALLAPYGPYLVDIGGDIAARGDGPDGGEGWLLSVADPVREGEDFCWLRVVGQAVATSTTLRRRWQRAGQWQHHLIDPRTGRPAESDLVQVTVIAPTAVEADIYAKTALILGRERSLDWLARRALPALLMGPGGATSTYDWVRFARKTGS